VWIEPPVPVWRRLAVTLWNLIIAYFTAFLGGRRHFDLVVTNTININVGALAAKLWGVPHLWYIREFGYEDHGWRFHLGEEFSLWLMNRLSSLCLAVSQAVARKYQGSIDPGKVHFLYQPIDVDLAGGMKAGLEEDPQQFTCIMVGRLQAGKRQEEAVRALAELRAAGAPVRLWLVGDGDPGYRAFLENLVREKNLGNQVRFFGQVNNALPYIQKADVLLLCSRCEAFARVVVEAMKAGKPVLGARSGGTVEQIRDGFNGFLYEPGNYQELAGKIRHLRENPQLAGEMGGNGREWAETTFTKQRYQDNLAWLLEKI
jgi:glycosyltransferase involved in cell wall biosynthesis